MCPDLEGLQLDRSEDGFHVESDGSCVLLGPEEFEETDDPGVAPAAVVNASIENSNGARMRVEFLVYPPLNGSEALDSDNGVALQSNCSDYNMTARLDRQSTQVVPIIFNATDETPGGFTWEAMATDLGTGVLLPAASHIGTDSPYDPMGFDGCQLGMSDTPLMFQAGTGVAFPWTLDAYNANNPDGGFTIYRFQAGLRGNITSCDITLDKAVFEGQLKAVDTDAECLVSDKGYSDGEHASIY